MAQPAQPRKPLLSHISLGVTSMYRSETFYNAVLAALDIKQVYRDVNDRRKTAGVCGWGRDTGKGEDEEFTLFLRPVSLGKFCFSVDIVTFLRLPESSFRRGSEQCYVRSSSDLPLLHRAPPHPAQART